jgi:hypothetical protein
LRNYNLRSGRNKKTCVVFKWSHSPGDFRQKIPRPVNFQFKLKPEAAAPNKSTWHPAGAAAFFEII